MSSSYIRKVGKSMFGSLKLPNMDIQSNQDKAFPFEINAWKSAYQIPEIRSDDIQEGYILAAVTFYERGKAEKTDFTRNMTAENENIMIGCLKIAETLVQEGILKEAEIVPLLVRLAKSVDFAEKHFGSNGYLRVFAKPFEPLITSIIERENALNSDENIPS